MVVWADMTTQQDSAVNLVVNSVELIKLNEKWFDCKNQITERTYSITDKIINLSRALKNYRNICKCLSFYRFLRHCSDN